MFIFTFLHVLSRNLLFFATELWLHQFKSSTGAWKSKYQYQLSVCIILKIKIIVFWLHPLSYPLVLENQNVNINYQCVLSFLKFKYYWVLIAPFKSSTVAGESKCQYQLSVCIIILKFNILVSFYCTHISHPLVLENQNVNINYNWVLSSWKIKSYCALVAPIQVIHWCLRIKMSISTISEYYHPLVLESQNVNMNYQSVLSSWNLRYYRAFIEPI